MKTLKIKNFKNINEWLEAKWLNMHLNNIGYGSIPTLKLYRQNK